MMIIEEAGEKNEKERWERPVDDVVMWMRFQSRPPPARAVSRAGIFCFVSFLSLKSHTYSIHEISSMFGFDRK